MEYYNFYKKYIDGVKESPVKQNVVCPFHADTSPSLSIDLDTGLFYCHSCQTGGDIFSFYMKLNNVPFKRAKQDILGNRDVQILSMAYVEEAHARLIKSEPLCAVLFAKRGWSKDIIIKFKLGWDEERVTIPILNQEGDLINVRKYDVLHKSKDKFRGIPGHNDTAVFPMSNLVGNLLLVFAGEPDTILANQLGFNAVTFTSGEPTVPLKLLPLFKNKVVYICYDTDTEGKRSSLAFANKLNSIAQKISIIRLDENILASQDPKGKPGKDFTDFFIACAEKGIDFVNAWNILVKEAEVFVLDEQKPIDYSDYLEVDFYKSIDPIYYGKNIRIKALAIGSTMSPYFCPRKIKFKCNFSKGDGCKACSMFMSGGEFDYLVQDKNLPELINIESEQLKKKLKDMIGILKCNGFEIEVTEVMTIEGLWITPLLSRERVEQKFVTRKSYITTHGTTTNKIFEFFGKTIPDPEDQSAIHWFTKAEPVVADLTEFQLSEEYVKALKIFQPEEDTEESVELKFLEICEDINYNGPESAIIDREDLMIAFDLVFHTVLRFKVFGNEINKGWGECLILGDTGTGKTQIANKLLKHYQAGEYVTLEKSTTAGLIGGVSNLGKVNVFTWGLLPINDGRLVILDEANGLDSNAISDMSAIRSSGIAERTVVGATRRTFARVRAIWISNPRSNARNIKFYSSGVEAIRELIGRPEDIQRFDFAIIVGSDEISSEIINSKTRKKVTHIYTSELCNKLVTWAWSRKMEDVIFLPSTEKIILDCAIAMGKKYSDSIPLVQATTQRIKLARLAASVACRLFSTNDGINVIVKPCHIEFVKNYLERIYNTQNFNYADWSALKEKETNVVSSMEYVKKIIYDMNDPISFVGKILSTIDISMADLEDFSKYENKEKVKFLRTELVQANCIKRVGNFYRKNPEFTLFLKPLFKGMQRIANK